MISRSFVAGNTTSIATYAPRFVVQWGRIFKHIGEYKLSRISKPASFLCAWRVNNVQKLIGGDTMPKSRL